MAWSELAWKGNQPRPKADLMKILYRSPWQQEFTCELVEERDFHYVVKILDVSPKHAEYNHVGQVGDVTCIARSVCIPIDETNK